jgi:acetyl-CoA decarbonylase/synthase complex subunit gamma
MALTALEIYKHLPKKNCNECGVPTCLAFAMALANMKANLEKCPYVSEESKKTLSSSAAPPIRLVKIGKGDVEVTLGDEVVLHRHEKTFYHPTAFAGLVKDTTPHAEIEQYVKKANELRFERVGQLLKLDLLAVKCKSNDAGKFVDAIKLINAHNKLPLVLICDNPDIMAEALNACGSGKPLVHAANAQNYEKMAKLAKENACPLAVHDDRSLDELAALAGKVKALGVEDIVLDFGHKPLGKTIENLTIIRRLAIKKGYRPLGYPVISVFEDRPGDEVAWGAIATMKYGSAVVFEDISPSKLYPLMTLRQNIYTDPQKPIQVKPGLYEINTGHSQESPVLVTTNFSLTYFTVAGDIEKSKVPSYLLVADTEGLSVLTSFAAGKFTPELVVKYMNEFGLNDKVKHRKIIIPGMVARMSAKLKELSTWEVIVGPRDSSGIPSYLKNLPKL